METLLIIPIIVSFIICLILTPMWIKRAKSAGHVGKDMNKFSKSEAAESGGIGVVLGFVIGTLIYVAINTFYFKSSNNLIEIFAILTSILIISFIGFIDDLFGWKIGLTKKTRIIFMVLAAVPLMVLNAGHSEIMGINVGLWYALFFIPIGIVGASATYNFLAGYNGLEVSQGIIIFLGLAFVLFKLNQSWLSLICLLMVFSLVAFYFYNRYPAKAFPGDVITNSIGALIAIMAILGNIEKIAIFFFIPYILETFLKLRGRLRKESFGKPNPDGSIELPYSKFYGLEHISIWLQKKTSGRATEKGVVYIINAFQIMIILLGLYLFRNSIF